MGKSEVEREFCVAMNQKKHTDHVATESRALVCVDVAHGVGRSSGQPEPALSLANAAFLTQLIACRERFAPYRARRRADPDVAADAYRAAHTLIRHA
jgi:hypothetical protein